MTADLPYFIKIRGCINCEVSKSHKEKTGNDYGFDHEAGVGCLLRNCMRYGHSIEKPFIDPEELVRLVLVGEDRDRILQVKTLLTEADEQYQSWFKSVGINLQQLIKNLESKL